MYIAQSHDWKVQRKLHIHWKKKRKKKKNKREKRNPIAILQEKSVSHSIHTKCFQIVHKYQRHYEKFFGDETKVQESQGNRANERKQSSSCLCFLKDNQTSRLEWAPELSEQETRACGPALIPWEIHLSALSVRTKAWTIFSPGKAKWARCCYKPWWCQGISGKRQHTPARDVPFAQ